jgi:hypothetical protein
VEGGGHPLTEPGDRQLTVATLGSLIVGDHPDLGTQLLEESDPLAGSERRRPGHIKAKLHPGVDLVGVLAAGPAARGEAELELGQRDGQ